MILEKIPEPENVPMFVNTNIQSTSREGRQGIRRKPNGELLNLVIKRVLYKVNNEL